MLWVMNPEKRSQNIENAMVLAKNNIFDYVLTEKLIIKVSGNYILTSFGFVI